MTSLYDIYCDTLSIVYILDIWSLLYNKVLMGNTGSIKYEDTMVLDTVCVQTH